jgi:hypothetical protein
MTDKDNVSVTEAVLLKAGWLKQPDGKYRNTVAFSYWESGGLYNGQRYQVVPEGVTRNLEEAAALEACRPLITEP